MADISVEKKGVQGLQETDCQSVDNGALERFQSESPRYSPEAERRLVRKIDFM